MSDFLPEAALSIKHLTVGQLALVETREDEDILITDLAEGLEWID